MSEENEAQSKRNERRGEGMLWRSEIWAGLELDFGSDQEPLDPEAEAWIKRIAQEPWVAGLLQLTERRGWWVGTEEWLFDELKRFAGEGVYRSTDFPYSLDELLEYQAIAHEPFRRLELGVVDYREILVDHFLYRYDAPEWDWDNNVLVYRGNAALRTYFLRAEEHPDPLPLTLLLIAARGTSGAYKSWGGSTLELMDAMREEYGLARSNVDEYLRLFGNWDPTDYPAFHKRMEACRPFLEEIGVRLRKRKLGGYGVTVSDEAEGDHDHTFWIVEVPAWKHKRGLMD
jgi:hypothetical protein